MANTSLRRVILDLRGAGAARKSVAEINQMFGDVLGGKTGEYMLKRLARRIEVYYIRPMMSELREVPPKRTFPEDYPIEYVSPAQQKKVHFILDGQPYQRTNRIVNAWAYKIKVRRNKISVEIGNPVRESKFVVGLVGTGESPRSIKRYLKPMQPFHMITGWQPAHEIVTEYIKEAKEDSVATIRQWLQQDS